jgi:hypothetical protein
MDGIRGIHAASRSRSMKHNPLAVVLACGLVAGIAPAAPVQTHDDDAAHVAHMPVTAPATRWATDHALRTGMARVRTALDELRHFEMGHMPTSMALERVTAIEDATKYMFAHCKLAPAADAALHGMLVPLLTAARRLKEDAQDVSAVAAMRSAVADYPRYFDDPQWPRVGESVHDTH